MVLRRSFTRLTFRVEHDRPVECARRSLPGRALVQGRRSLCLLLLLSILWPGPSRATPTIPPPEVISRARGVPSAQVHAIVQDRDGIVWIAGPAGLASYDGHAVRRVGRADGLTTQGLRTLALASDGGLWAGTDRGVDVRAAGGTFQPLVPEALWTYGFVDRVLELGPGEAALATSRGLVYWFSSGLVPETTPGLAGRLVTALALDQTGRLWVGGPQIGLRRRVGTEWGPSPAGLEESVGAVLTISVQPEGTLVVGGERGAVETDTEGRPVLSFDPPLPGRVTALLRDGDVLWAAGGRHLLRYRRTDTGWALLDTVASGVPVNGLLRDVQGNVWAATDNGGVLKYGATRAFLGRLPLPCGQQVYSIVPGLDGRSFWVGTEECVVRLDANSWRSGDPLAGLSGARVWDLLEDSDGTLWAATDRGVLRTRAGRTETFGAGDPVLAAPGRAFARRADVLFVGTRRGLARVDRDGVREVVDAEGQSLGYVYTLEVDRSGRLWVGTLGRGLWRLGDGAPEPVVAEGLRATGNTYSVAEGPAGRFAVLQDDRIVLLEGDRPRSIQPATTDAVAGWSARFGVDGTLWVGGSSGLVAYDVTRGQVLRRLTRGAGLAGDEFTTSRSLAIDRRGNLLCGMDGGLSLVRTDRLAELPSAPEPRLSGVHWQGAEASAVGPPTSVSQGRWTLRLELSVPWYAEEGPVRVRHRLRGLRDEWSEAGGFEVEYASLPAGQYSLEAQAGSPLAGWGPVKRLYDFRVRPPWWSRPFGLAGMTAAAALAIALAWRFRTRRLLRKAAALEALVQSRTAALATANADLADANRIKDEMLGTVAHDLRSPLTVILAYVGLLEAGALHEPVRTEALRTVGQSGRRMLGLINDLLDVARIAAGRLQLQPSEVDIDAYLADVVAANGVLGRQKEIELSAVVEPGLPPIRLDADRVRQVLDNFISNAFKFSPPGSAVRVEALRVDTEVEIAVVDQGRGIPAEELTRVFEAFEQASTKATSGERGWGLGLAIARRLVELHGGTIFAESQPGRGSRFGFRLPASPVPGS